MNKSITFLLSAVAPHPIGGYKVVYEYANRFANDGYNVRIIYSAYTARYNVSKFINCLRFIKAFIRYIRYSVVKYEVPWFELDKRIKESVVLRLSEKQVSNEEILVATAIGTAIILNSWNFSPKNKVYLIQGYENWNGISDEIVLKTYSFPMKKIAISSWLYKIVNKYDHNCCFIPNGFDFSFFKKYIEMPYRDKYNIAMLYHKQELKGCKDGFEAMNIVKQHCPQLSVTLFGVPNEPSNLPNWMTYYQQPDQTTFNKIYNKAAIFIGTSWSEGWGLTIGEAMICGCAVACTDNNGYKEMVQDGYNALLSPIKDPQRLADNIIKLINDDSLREFIADNGCKFIKQFNWENSYRKFKSLIEE